MNSESQPIEPLVIDPSNGDTPTSCVIYLHGLGDEGASYENLANQIHRAGKLEKTRFVLPTAPFSHDAGQRAWYQPTSVTDPDVDGEVEAFEEAFMTVDSLIASQVEAGIPRSKIIVGGFSQGGAVSILWAVRSQTKQADRVGGIVCVASYIPFRGKFKELITSDKALLKDQPVLILHGQQDTLVPMWVAMKGPPLLEEVGFEVNYAMIPGMQHSMTGQTVGALCAFLESVLEEEAGDSQNQNDAK